MQVIAEDPNTDVVVLSDVDRDVLAQAIALVPCWLVAEGGACYRGPGSDVWVSTGGERDFDWMEPVRNIMDYFTARTPGDLGICSLKGSVQ